MNKISLLQMAIDLIEIHRDIRFRLKGTSTEEFYVHDFDQTWGSTALGFGGVGGSAMTTARTYVLIPKDDGSYAYVYFGSCYAYDCAVNDAFQEDLRNHNMASVQVAGTKYRK